MNKVILIGNLTRDPEMHTTPAGVNKASFTIAVNRRFSNQQGVREADFIPIVAWRERADFCGRYLQKGKKICVVGSLQVRSYDAQDGSKRFVTEVVADELEFVTPASENPYPRQDAVPQAQSAPQYAATSEPRENASYQPAQMVEADDDELPF
ncbi:MAG: single-stranded DNA-binding protein [Clostridia bacterium]|nr:single-stranded DNA-binding protein [Clostridia bacterium]